jgi:plastocyanin
MILTVSMLAAACGSGGDGGQASGAGGDPDAHIRVNMTEYGFGSDVIEVRAGQTVEFLLKNSGDLDHEFMIGREVTVAMDGMATGFEHDFFEGLMPIVDPPEAGMVMESMEMDMDGDSMDMDDGSMDMDMDGDSMEMDMDDGSMEMDMDDGSMDMDGDDGSMDMDTDGHDDGHHGFMVTLAPGGTASVTVTIPDDAVGDWEIGCFQDKGTHWSSGMHATLRITS